MSRAAARILPRAGAARVFLGISGRAAAGQRGGPAMADRLDDQGIATVFGGSGFVGRYAVRGAGQAGLARARRRAPARISPASCSLPASSARCAGAGQPALSANRCSARSPAPSSSSTRSACWPAAASRRSAPSMSRGRAPSPRRRARPASASSCTSPPSAPTPSRRRAMPAPRRRARLRCWRNSPAPSSCGRRSSSGRRTSSSTASPPWRACRRCCR